MSSFSHAPRVLRLLSFVLLILPLFSAGAETTVAKSPASPWVALPEYNIPETGDTSLGSVRYIAVDFQSNIDESANYNHYATQILTRAGVEDYSQLSVDFQPDYQTLTWHSLEIIRKGVTQDRLPGTEFELIRQEKGLDRQLYDGEITAHAILSDIRPGDTIIYSYTITGANPIFSGKEHSFLQTQFGSPVDYLRRRFIWDSSLQSLRWQHSPASPDVLVHTEKADGKLDSLVFEKRESPALDVESNVPSSVTIYPFVEISDYASWEEFGKWTESIYLTGEELPEDIRIVCEEIKGQNLRPDETAVAALRWVQENIRYLGSFMGEHTHAPYTLGQICERRFGDCKDKGMLLTAMLRHLGLDAAPALVNTDERESIISQLPGYRNFDHLIVHLKLNGTDYWLDPTRTFQRGTLANSYAPAYGFAFVIRPDSTALHPVIPAGFDVIHTSITESFKIPDMSGKATMRVRTVATGLDADRLRYTFSADSLSDLEEDYRAYYESDYPGITVDAPMTFSDDEKQNRIVITESYALTDLWDREENDGEADQLYAWFYARYIASVVATPSETERKLPYAISHPTRYVHTLEIAPPEGWDIPEGEHSRKLPSLHYDYKISSAAGKAIVRFSYMTLADRVMPEDFANYKEAMKLFEDDLYYYLSSPIVVTEEGKEVQKSYTFVTAFLILGLLTGLLAAFILWFWDPAPRTPASHQNLQGLGGWLVLVIIGCFLLPLISIYEISSFYTIIDAESFTLFSGFERETMQRVSFGYGTFFSALILVLSIFQLILLFSCRSSFPWFFIIFGIFIFLSDSLFIYLSSLSSGMEITSEEGGGLISNLVGILIWTMYMHLSNRVKATFLRTRKSQQSSQSATPPPLPAAL
ncbi:MAG: DUF3857 domain-containing protein [Akkermansiaceae bacterium]|jgi:transglutaminase-like putative cysteine protease|nr:DUF3857 domain-containing protein [Akkermansiaceae bacterium]MDP4722102.1 DUF3857 domain-containing protein [Akkermansiaceae bacterium]MDP4781464.1 DUF3857 domain-containing protein [Akkermansiaceae bacterium]MDP4848097.1 DUF3857 domain-containing protein [Akkermansiaceae bacterium]MDP4899114.1 DUF3857 domain-containing protein [Akkermansiaceae bacterium]